MIDIISYIERLEYAKKNIIAIAIDVNDVSKELVSNNEQHLADNVSCAIKDMDNSIENIYKSLEALKDIDRL